MFNIQANSKGRIFGKRRLIRWLTLFGLSIGMAAIGLVLFTSPNGRFTVENARNLRSGMTIQQVKGLFGLPGKELPELDRLKGIPPFGDKTCIMWNDQSGFYVWALFDKDGLLISADMHTPDCDRGLIAIDVKEKISWLESMRLWLGLGL